jgi:hypothetical protein
LFAIIRITTINVLTSLSPYSLSQATSHENLGIATRVSYIVVLNIDGGEPPSTSLCTSNFGALKSIAM